MKHFLRTALAIAIVIELIGCFNPSGAPTPGIQPPITDSGTDIASWFEDIYLDLLERQEKGTMGQIANCQYVCNAINYALKEEKIVPAPGTELDIANCEYLLKTIDQINSGSTAYGTSQYATKQIVDTIAVNAMMTLIELLGTNAYILMGLSGSALSEDGNNWEAGDGSGKGYRLAYGNEVFVSVGEAKGNTGVADQVWSSRNGLSWSQNPTPLGAQWKDVCYANGKFIAVGVLRRPPSAGNTYISMCYSTDGTTWSLVSIPMFITGNIPNREDTIYGVCYGNGRYVAVGTGLPIMDAYANTTGWIPGIMHSTDGVNWTRITTALATSRFYNWESVRYLNNQFIAIGQNRASFPYTQCVAISSNGTSWAYYNMTGLSSISTSFAGISQISYGNGRYVAVGEDDFIAYSSDAITWTVVSYNAAGGAASPDWEDVIFVNGKFIAVSQKGAPTVSPPLIANSTNGISWVKVAAPLNRYWNTILYAAET